MDENPYESPRETVQPQQKPRRPLGIGTIIFLTILAGFLLIVVSDLLTVLVLGWRNSR